MKKYDLIKTISIITLSILLVLSVAFNIFILTVFEIKNVKSFKQALLCRELLESISQPFEDVSGQDTTVDTENQEPSTELPEEPAEVPSTARVVFAENGIKITYVKQELGLLGPTLTFLIENDGNQAMDISFTYVYIDGYVANLSGGYCENLAADRKAYTTVTLWEDDFKHFTDFPSNVEFVIKLIDPSSFDTVKQSDLIQIALS